MVISPVAISKPPYMMYSGAIDYRAESVDIYCGMHMHASGTQSESDCDNNIHSLHVVAYSQQNRGSNARPPNQIFQKRQLRYWAHNLLEIELWGRLVSLLSQVPSDYSNLYRQLDTTSSNFY
jgi:hypothetical protein